MTNVNTQITSFTSGELSPKVRGRFDLSAYYNGVRRMENWIPFEQGPATYRNGFHYVGQTKNNKKAFLYRFQFSDVQAYMLEFTAGNIRIYRDRGVVTSGGTPVDITTSYTEAQIFQLKFAQDATALYIVHPSHNPQKLVRNSDTSWSIGNHSPTGFSPVFAANDYPSAVTFYEQRLVYGGTNNNPETLWFSKSDDPDDFTIGTGATDGLKYTVASGESSNKIEWLKGDEESLLIGGFGDVLRATGGQGDEAIAPNQISIKPTNTFGVADINPIGTNQSILYAQRNGLTIRSYELDDLAGRKKAKDTNIIADHILNTGVTQICFQSGRPDVMWAVKTNGDLVGMTYKPEQEVTGWHKHTTQGEFISAQTTPREIQFDDLWVCVKRNINGTDYYYIEYYNDSPDFPEKDDFVTGEDNKASDLETYQRALIETQKQYIHLDSAVTFDGSVRGLDASAALNIGAVSGTGITFTTTASVFTSGDVGNEIWLKSTDGTRFGRAEIVTYNSGTSVDVNITVEFDSTTQAAAGDWYITANTITGLSHLEGETVKVINDGAVHPDRTVSSGQITLDTEASVVHVGLGYTGWIETMDLEGGGTNGTSQTKKKSVRKVGVRLLNTLGLSFGTSYYNLERRKLRNATMPMNGPPLVVTRDEVVPIEDEGEDHNGGRSREKRLIIRQDQALPATIELLTPYYSVSNND